MICMKMKTNSSKIAENWNGKTDSFQLKYRCKRIVDSFSLLACLFFFYSFVWFCWYERKSFRRMILPQTHWLRFVYKSEKTLILLGAAIWIPDTYWGYSSGELTVHHSFTKLQGLGDAGLKLLFLFVPLTGDTLSHSIFELFNARFL